MTSVCRRWIAAGLAAVLAAPASSHEFWIVPDRFTVARGDAVGVGLRVGTGWPGEDFGRQDRRIVRFAWIDASGERPLEGGEGDVPAGRVGEAASGTAIAVYRSTDATAELDAATFEAYLREEGLEQASAERAERGLSGAAVRERYSRCAKAILGVTSGRARARRTGPSPVDVTRPVGLDLEIVPLADPRDVLRARGMLPIRVTWRGAPARGLLVKAQRQGEPAVRITARTDADGRATVRLPSGGIWLVNTVRMQAAPEGSGFDWQSTWSSLTFEARSRNP